MLLRGGDGGLDVWRRAAEGRAPPMQHRPKRRLLGQVHMEPGHQLCRVPVQLLQQLRLPPLVFLALPLLAPGKARCSALAAVDVDVCGGELRGGMHHHRREPSTHLVDDARNRGVVLHVRDRIRKQRRLVNVALEGNHSYKHRLRYHILKSLHNTAQLWNFAAGCFERWREAKHFFPAGVTQSVAGNTKPVEPPKLVLRLIAEDPLLSLAAHFSHLRLVLGFNPVEQILAHDTHVWQPDVCHMLQRSVLRSHCLCIQRHDFVCKFFDQSLLKERIQ
mmetsp:Transcript_24867/g.49685  ORF Transcript_24867/g.49685 Transcript_24867/m.49685 type:complete len:276 (+) Transcript_24867:272-1099(+)